MRTITWNLRATSRKLTKLCDIDFSKILDIAFLDLMNI